MHRLPAISSVLLLLLAAVACGRAGQVPAGTLCSASYEPRELVERGPLYPAALPSAPGPAPGQRITDVAAIKKIAAAACSLPTPPDDVMCTAELGPSYELRFVDARGQTTTVTAASFGCQFVEGLGSRRYDARPLWDALKAAGLPTPR